MTKRDYIEIARALFSMPIEFRRTPEFAQVVDTIAAACQRDNPRFDRARFDRACYQGVIQERAGTRLKAIGRG